MYIRDTIAAISTPAGNGGIGIIRVSGDLAASIGHTIFRPVHSGGFVSHRFYFGSIIDPDSGVAVDEGMAVLMKAPRSYTREDVLELHCHGGMLLVERVLALTLRQGVRLAEPGEFTRRAFLNGRIDLVQAEAVMDIITSRTDASLNMAQRQREGTLSRRMTEAAEHLRDALALVEAYIDFPEDDLGATDLTAIVSAVDRAGSITAELLAGYEDGRVLREGIAVLILGKPNVGKSSLLNRLLDENRAIVTDIPGTTRDIIEETVNLGGLPVRLLDTAGIHHTEDVVEQEGIRRALDKIPQADLVLLVLDASRELDQRDRLIIDSLGSSRYLILLNKCDLPRALQLPVGLDPERSIALSTVTGEGMPTLRDTIRNSFLHSLSPDSREVVAISRARHRDALQSVADTLQRVTATIVSGSIELELLSIELREALAAIGAVTGQTTTDDVLDRIFSTFCIGK